MKFVADQLSQQFGTRFLHSPSQMAHYCRDESYHTGPAPDGVVLPRTTGEVAAILRICSDAGMPVIPYGAGTSLEGHIIVVDRAIVIDFREMSAILSVNASDLDCICQPGVTREELNRYLRDTGLYFPIDPGADATLGGMVSTSASGTTAVRYGTVKENVLSLEVVLADGSVIRTGRRARKTAAGYDLTHLFVGAEGTLGLITELCLRLHGIPEVTRSATCTFATLSAAVESVIEIVQLAIPIARIELMDEHQVEACNRFSGIDKPVAPTLLFEFHGSAAETEDHIQRVKLVLEGQGAGDLDWATRPEDGNRLWKARHSALAAAKSLRPSCEVLITDVAVPISRLADCIMATRNDIDQANLCAPIVGHVGDGNFHVFFVINPNDALECEKVATLSDRLARRAIEMDGTCTGEHGIGLGKKGLLEYEMGRGAVDVMRVIKQRLDPKHILNPGKIFDYA